MPLQKNSPNKIKIDKLGIDIGSKFLKASITNDQGLLLDVFTENSNGVEYGVIVDEEACKESIKNLIQKIKNKYSKLPDQIIIGIGGLGLKSSTSFASVFTSRADGYITDLDVEKLYSIAKEKNESSKNKYILHTILIKTCVDGNEVIGSPEGLKGYKIESKILLIYNDIKQIEIINRIFDELKIEFDEILASPLADAYISLSKREKRIGSCSINIGADTTSICVYENSVPILVSVIKTGGENFTSDIALGLKTSIDAAEEIKIGNINNDYSKRKYEDIIESRINDLSNKINNELNKIFKAGLLPGGVVLLGGGSQISKIDEYLKYYLKLPVNFAINNLKLSQKYNINKIEYATSYGLTFFLNKTNEYSLYLNIIKKLFNRIIIFIKKYLP